MNEEILAITLRCASCGANLEITPEMTSLACGYCGTQQLVQRRGGAVSLKLISEAIARVQLGTDRTASELAIRRIREELAAIGAEVEAERTKLEASHNNGDTRVGYWALALIILFITTTRLLTNHQWPEACFAAACAVFVGYHTRRHIRAQGRVQTHRKIGPLEARSIELRRQLAKHHEVVSS